MTVEDTQVTGIVFSKDARKKLYNGLRLAAEAVSCTLGPNGKTVLIQNGDNSPIITKDGVTVSKSVRLPDPLEMMGAQLLREAASQTNDVAGDGTTTSTVLTHALVKEGMKLLDAGYNSKKLCNGVDIAAKTITQFITMMSHKVRQTCLFHFEQLYLQLQKHSLEFQQLHLGQSDRIHHLNQLENQIHPL